MTSPPKGKSVSAFPSFKRPPTPLRYSKPAERRGEEEERRCDGPPLQQQDTTMDAVIKASFASLSLTAVVAHRLASGDGSGDAMAERQRDVLKRKTYSALRNRYFGAYFFALFGTTDVLKTVRARLREPTSRLTGHEIQPSPFWTCLYENNFRRKKM